MAYKMMYSCIPNDDTQNYPFSSLNYWLKRQLNKPNNQNSLNSTKLLSQRIRKRYYKTKDKWNKQPIVPSLYITNSGCYLSTLNHSWRFPWQRERRQWAFYFTSPQIFYNNGFLMVCLTTLGTFINFD